MSENKGKIEDLKFDTKNFNKHTEKGMKSLKKSLSSYGAGRSILVDKDNNIIAGNGIAEVASKVGITKTRIIETTGDELVVVKRTDVSLDSKQGREMALADNATSALDLAWDEDVLAEETEKWDMNTSEWLSTDTEEDKEEQFIDPETENFVVEIYCNDEEEQEAIFSELQGRGLKCKIS